MLDKNSFLTGDLISLRGFQADDLPGLYRWWDDERVTEFLEMGARPTRDKDASAFLELARESDDAVVFAIEEKDGGRVVGTCGLFSIGWICRRAQFNILIGEPDAWDKGYGREAASLLLGYAFNKLNLNSVQLGVNADNKRAVRSCEKCGFVHEGVRRQFIYCGGRYHDTAMMSVLRDEFLAD